MLPWCPSLLCELSIKGTVWIPLRPWVYCWCLTQQTDAVLWTCFFCMQILSMQIDSELFLCVKTIRRLAHLHIIAISFFYNGKSQQCSSSTSVCTNSADVLSWSTYCLFTESAGSISASFTKVDLCFSNQLFFSFFACVCIYLFFILFFCQNMLLWNKVKAQNTAGETELRGSIVCLMDAWQV